MSFLRRLTPGLLLTGGVAGVAFLGALFEAKLFGNAVVDGLVLAILLGIAVRTVLRAPGMFEDGIDVCAKQVLEVAVFGIPHEAFGEMVHAEVVSKPGTSISAEAIIAVCREHIGGYKVPRSVAIRSDALPKSGAGKILKRSLREPYWQGKDREVN